MILFKKQHSVNTPPGLKKIVIENMLLCELDCTVTLTTLCKIRKNQGFSLGHTCQDFLANSELWWKMIYSFFLPSSNNPISFTNDFVKKLVIDILRS